MSKTSHLLQYPIFIVNFSTVLDQYLQGQKYTMAILLKLDVSSTILVRCFKNDLVKSNFIGRSFTRAKATILPKN